MIWDVTYVASRARNRLEVDDTFSMVAKADDVGFIKLLSTFAAANLDRLPHLKPEDLDICILTKKLDALQQVVEKHVIATKGNPDSGDTVQHWLSGALVNVGDDDEWGIAGKGR